MNGIEKIAGRINEDAQREIDEITAQAKAEADAITARYQAQADKESADILARGKQNAEERVERLASVAQLEAKKMTLAAKQFVLDEAFDEALKQLTELPQEKYVALLAALAVKGARSGKEKLIFSPTDRNRYGVKVAAKANGALGEKGNLTLSEETRDIRGGLLLSDGDVEVNCAFETLVRLSRNQIAGEVAKVLFD
jgi:V/A-type H+-transporting ATPase subunit E